MSIIRVHPKGRKHGMRPGIHNPPRRWEHEREPGYPRYKIQNLVLTPEHVRKLREKGWIVKV